MCGIIGYYGNNVKDFLRSPRIELLTHRGPDNQSSLIGQNYFIGHTRLSIQDLSDNANQPMKSSDNLYILSFNGEIYNHISLRNKYLNEIDFKSSGDTETLLYGLIKYGEKFILKLNGIFSFSFLNLSTGDFLIVRDHFGVKPLYYRINEDEIYFSSELKSILSHNKQKAKINTNAIKNYINFLWSPGDQTPFKEYKKLLPGHLIKGNLKKIKTLSITRYYSIPFSGNYFNNKTEDKLVRMLESKLLKAIERQMLSDVPIGFFLSGGLDSSLLVAMARKINPKKKINCYTINSESLDGFTNDLFYARKVAKYLNVDLKIVNAKSDILKDFDKVIYYLDEPQSDPAAINVYNICKAARDDGIKVLISGTGGDDVFSGYRRHRAIRIHQFIDMLPLPLLKLIKKISIHINVSNSLSRRIKKLIYNIELKRNERILGLYSWIDKDILKKLFINDNDYDCFIYFKELEKLIKEEPSELNKMLFWDLNTFLVDHNLNYTDKLGMASGVEVRVPYLDIDLVKFSTKIPPSLKLKGNTTKYLLKRVAEKYLPNEVIYRPKTGFGAPVRKWIKNDMNSFINDYLSQESIEKRKIFNYDKIKELIDLNASKKEDLAYPIWSLLAIESWLRQFHDINI
tara:strand:+ start:15043 stop:16926 length:1884 start_codon:yes stop_codon:yes gene_type:complete